MAHNCLDWSSNPPTRKIPLLVLSCGNDQVYTPVPQDFKVLEQVARKEFSLGDAKIFLSSSCVNFCNGRPARIMESTWEHLSPFIGCATVEVCQPTPNDSESRPCQDAAREEQPTSSEVTGKQLDSSTQGTLPSSTEKLDGHENEPPEQGPERKPDDSPDDVVRDQRDAPSDHGKDRDIPTDQHEKIQEEESGAILPPKSRVRRRAVVSEDEEEDSTEGSERERKVSKSQVLPAASPPTPTQLSKEIKERDDHQLSQRDSERESDELHRPNKRKKQEKDASESQSRQSLHEEVPPPRAGTQSEHSLTQTQADPSEKLTIRVAHRLSKQESKFTVKGTTSVTKVLAGVCKSFRLHVNRASLYLIIATEEDGAAENLFPCDKDDSIARAGAERDVESKFLVKVGGEA